MPVYLRSCTVHAELSSLYIKVIILALVILFPHVSFPSYSLHGLLQNHSLQPGNFRSSSKADSFHLQRR